MNQTVTIPPSIRAYPFYKEGEEQHTYALYKEEQLPFIELIKKVENKETIYISVDDLESLLKKWQTQEMKLEDLYEERNKDDVKTYMISSIATYITFLFWMNQKLLPNIKGLQTELDELKLKPVNCKERLLFVLSKPYLYHSFVQLRELYKETEKAYRKQLAIQKSRQTTEKSVNS